MIVRTYGRRSRPFSDGGGGARGTASAQDAFDFDDGDDLDALGSSASQPLPSPPAPSQESSSMWDFEEEAPPSPPPRLEERRRGKGGRRGGGGGWELAEPPTATLMEAEYGEIMESLDEVTFALDGLRAAAPRRTRRSSLLALLGICASAERRRMLLAHGKLSMLFWFWTLMTLAVLLLQGLFYLFWQAMSKIIICWIQKLVFISFLSY